MLGRLIELYPDVQLATLVDKAPEGDQWVHEIKFDGYRLLGFLAEGVVRSADPQWKKGRTPELPPRLRRCGN